MAIKKNKKIPFSLLKSHKYKTDKKHKTKTISLSVGGTSC